MPTTKEQVDYRTYDERLAARKAFELSMRQAVMEFDAMDTGGGDEGQSDNELDFYEFSRLVREREIGVHSEQALRDRLQALDQDGSGTIDKAEFITFALRDAFVRSAANLSDLFSEWDNDGNGMVDREEFREVVRHYGFRADDAIIDAVFGNLDSMNRGQLELHDLSMRLQQEVRDRTKPMHRLRCLEWREGAQAEVKRADQMRVDHRKPVGEQIMAVLQAQNARVMELFRSWDTDGDALISKKEFRKVVVILGFEDAPKASIDELFDELDADGSGEINYMEMKDAICPPEEETEPEVVMNPYKGWNAMAKRQTAISLSDRSKGASIVKGIRLSPDYDIISQVASGLAKNWGKLQWLFAQWDEDGSGTISRKELRRALEALGLESHKRAINALFDAMDSDGSGEVSYDEFELAIRASLRAAKSEAIKAAAAGAGTGPAKLPVISANYSQSSQPSPRNRVGRTDGYDMVDRQHVIMKPAPHKPFIAKPPPPAAEAVPVPHIPGEQRALVPIVSIAARPRAQLPPRVPRLEVRVGEKHASPRHLKLGSSRHRKLGLEGSAGAPDHTLGPWQGVYSGYRWPFSSSGAATARSAHGTQY
jgi:Ca2+-binding EF-hand superfamily protein